MTITFWCWPWTLTHWTLNVIISPSCIFVWNVKSVCQTYWRYRVRTKPETKLKSSLDLWPFNPKMYKHLLDQCMKYESCALKITQVIVSEAKCWQSSVATLTFDLLTPKSIGVFLSLSSICVWNIKFVGWEIVELSHYNKMLIDRVDKVQLWPWPLTF